MSIFQKPPSSSDRDSFLLSFVRHLRFRRGQLERDSEQGASVYIDEERVIARATDANLITSRYEGEGIETHALLLDLDVEHIYVPSSTEGHGHLYVNLKLSRGEWERVMRELALVGVIGAGYREHSLRRGYASLRPPWVKKSDELDPLFGAVA